LPMNETEVNFVFRFLSFLFNFKFSFEIKLCIFQHYPIMSAILTSISKMYLYNYCCLN
jgi:hypothetical protein